MPLRPWLQCPRPRVTSRRGACFRGGMLSRGLRGFLTDSMEEASWNRALRAEVGRGRICPESSKLPNLSANTRPGPKTKALGKRQNCYYYIQVNDAPRSESDALSLKTAANRLMHLSGLLKEQA